MAIRVRRVRRGSPTCLWSIRQNPGRWSTSRLLPSTASVATRAATWCCSRTAHFLSAAARPHGPQWRMDFATCGTTTTGGWAASRRATYPRVTTGCCWARRLRWRSRWTSTAAATAIACISSCAATTPACPRQRLLNSCDFGARRRKRFAPPQVVKQAFSPQWKSSTYELVPVRLTLDTEIDLAILTPTHPHGWWARDGRGEALIRRAFNVDRRGSHSSSAGHSCGPPQQARTAQAGRFGRVGHWRFRPGRVRTIQPRDHRRSRGHVGARQVDLEQEGQTRSGPDLPADPVQGLGRQSFLLSYGAH